MIVAGKRCHPVGVHVPLFSFTITLLISTCSIPAIGLLIASIVPTARFAQPIGATILYPMIAISGLFVPIKSFSPVLRAVARALPLTYTVALLEGIWNGDAWSAHAGDIAALAAVFLVCTALSSKVFRWGVESDFSKRATARVHNASDKPTRPNDQGWTPLSAPDG